MPWHGYWRRAVCAIWGVIDALIDGMSHRSSSESDSRQDSDTRHILRLGVTQLLFSDIPPYAAINQAGEMAVKLGLKRQQPFINAILRNVQRDGAARLAALDHDRYAAPPWLTESWRKSYGQSEARAMFAALMHDPALDVTPIGKKMSADDLAAALTGVVLPTGSIRVREAGRIENLPHFQEGTWQVQDAAAALPARLLGDVRGKHILDLCAAPGGKNRAIGRWRGAGGGGGSLGHAHCAIDGKSDALGVERSCGQRWLPMPVFGVRRMGNYLN